MEDQAALQLDITISDNSPIGIEKGITAAAESHEDDDLIRRLDSNNLQDSSDLMKPCPIPSETEVAPIDPEKPTLVQNDTDTKPNSNDVRSSTDAKSKTAADSETPPDSAKPELTVESVPVERNFVIRIVQEGTELQSLTVERSLPSSYTTAVTSEPFHYVANGVADMCTFMIDMFTAIKQSLNVDNVSTPKETVIQPGRGLVKEATTTSASKPKAAATETSKSPEKPFPEAGLSGAVCPFHVREVPTRLEDTASMSVIVGEYSDGNGAEYYPQQKWPPIITDSYEIGQLIGSGSFGRVYLALHGDMREQMAIKVLRKNFSTNNIGYTSNERIDFEVSVAKSLKDPHIVNLHNVHSEEDHVFMMMEFMAGGTLSRLIDERRILDENSACYYLRQLCSGVKYLHKQQLGHFDIKPDNLLLLNNEQRTILKLADFGMCRSTQNGPVRLEYRGTVFSAPEVVNYDNCTCAADIWSIGVVMVVMLCGKLPFENIASVKAAKFETKMVDGIADRGKSFLINIFKDEPDSRPSIDLLLGDTWLDESEPQ